MLRTSVCFEHHGHQVEYGVQRREAGGSTTSFEETGRPFVEVDGKPIALIQELLDGWKRRAFGDEVRAYMQRYYPSEPK